MARKLYTLGKGHQLKVRSKKRAYIHILIDHPYQDLTSFVSPLTLAVRGSSSNDSSKKTTVSAPSRRETPTVGEGLVLAHQ